MTVCNKCGDESNSDPDLICGRNMADGTGLPIYCDGIYRGGDGHVVTDSPLRTRVMLVAAEIHVDENCEIDQDARVTKVDEEGYWVTAHLWVPKEAL